MNCVVIISNKGARVLQKFQDEEMGRSFYLKLLNNVQASNKVYLVSLTNPIPKPQDYKPSRYGTLWCPYCEDERRYYSNDLGTNTCPICHITDQEYYVRQYNGLWGEGEGSKKRRNKNK